MTITVNGEAHTVDDGTTLAAWLDACGLARAQVAVERNGAIVGDDVDWDGVLLCDGDRLEIVRFVGGG